MNWLAPGLVSIDSSRGPYGQGLLVAQSFFVSKAEVSIVAMLGPDETRFIGHAFIATTSAIGITNAIHLGQRTLSNMPS